MRTRPSPVEKWPGTITLRDQVGYPDLIAFDNAWAEAEKFLGAEIPGQLNTYQIASRDVNHYRYALLPGLLHFVESHDLKGLPTPLTAENFPAAPRIEAARLFVWLRDEVQKIVLGIDNDPKANELPETPIAMPAEN